MKITEKWLKEKSACSDGIEWFSQASQNDPVAVLKLLISEDRLQWANWLVCRLMDKPNKVRYAIFAALEVIHIYERKYPADKRPRKAIEAAQAWFDNPNAKTKAAAAAAAAYADAAADAAADDAAAYAYTYAYAAANAAYAAAYAAAAAAAAYAYADAAADAAADDAAATYAAAAARNKLQIKILEYGMKLLEEKEAVSK